MKRAGAGATIAEFTILSSSKSVDNDGQLDTDVTNHNPVEILLKVGFFWRHPVLHTYVQPCRNHYFGVSTRYIREDLFHSEIKVSFKSQVTENISLVARKRHILITFRQPLSINPSSISHPRSWGQKYHAQLPRPG